jgi:translation initiation factor 5A
MQVHIPLIDKRVGQVISIIGETIQLMDSETFETIDVTLIDEEINGTVANSQNVEYWNVMGRIKIMRIKN